MAGRNNDGFSQGIAQAISGLGSKVVELSRDKWWKLALSILIDFLGILSYILPLIGEFADIFWAPLASILLFQMYGNPFLSGIALLEEALPFTDFIPTATIGWLCEFTVLGVWLGLNLSQPQQPMRPNPRFQQVN